MPPHTTISLPVHTTDALTRGERGGTGTVRHDRELGWKAAAPTVWSASTPHTTNSWPSHAPCVVSETHAAGGSGITVHCPVTRSLALAERTVVAGVVATDWAR